MSNSTTDEVEAIRLNFQQRRQAMLIAESRGIDDDTACELIYLRAEVDALRGENGLMNGVIKTYLRRIEEQQRTVIRLSAEVEQLKKKQDL